MNNQNKIYGIEIENFSTNYLPLTEIEDSLSSKKIDKTLEEMAKIYLGEPFN